MRPSVNLDFSDFAPHDQPLMPKSQGIQMTAINPTLELRLNPNRIAAIMDSAIISSSEVVNFHFNALSNADLGIPAEPVEATFRLRGPQMDAAQRRAMHENWILAKSFQELLRAVRHALEQAHIFSSLLTKKHSIKSASTLADFLKPFEKRASALTFPELIDAVNEKLNPKLEFAESYRSQRHRV